MRGCFFYLYSTGGWETLGRPQTVNGAVLFIEAVVIDDSLDLEGRATDMAR